MDVVKVGWSGGKDSTCSVLLHLEQGDYVKACCYIPMFTKEIPLICKSHYEFILRTADNFRSMGAEVYIVSGMTYWEFVLHRASKGKNKGKIMGFPIPKEQACTFRNYSKIRALKSIDVGHFDYEDIGIAYDEIKRLCQLNDKKRSILFEQKYTEKMALRKCISGGVLSPHYQFEHRDGCSLCPNARESRRALWFADYPEAVPLVIQLQDIVKRERRERAPLRGYEWFIDTDQISFFD